MTFTSDWPNDITAKSPNLLDICVRVDSKGNICVVRFSYKSEARNPN
jgi:hypothetical protein